MIARTAAEIARATGGRVVAGDGGVRCTTVSTDSRTLAPGDLFIAIAGETHDGHDHAADAAAKGAAIVLAHRELPPLPGGVTVVRVDDTTAALGRLGADERRRRQLVVVGITGSAGKTTTRALTAAALGARWRTAASAGNLNNHWGLPLSLLRLDEAAEAAVLEMGMNHAGEIEALARIARPDVGIITNVGTAHIGNLGSKEAIAAAKAELLYQLPAEATAVVHAGSPELAPHLVRCGRRILRFGFEPDADLVPRDIGGDLVRGARFFVDDTEVRLALWGRHAVLNALAALGAARALGVPLADAAARLAGVDQPAGRGRVLRLAGDVALVDEVYNANPSAMDAVLAEVASVPWPGRKVAVLGDMLELGEFAAVYHRALGRQAAAAASVVHAVGAFAEDVAAGAREAGAREVYVHRDASAAGAVLPAHVTDGDLVVVKGSRGVRLEQVRDALVAARGGRTA